MTRALVWQVRPKSSYKSLDYELRINLEQKFSFPIIVSYELIPYLEGLESCGIKGARELIELIGLYCEIELNIE